MNEDVWTSPAKRPNLIVVVVVVVVSGADDA